MSEKIANHSFEYAIVVNNEDAIHSSYNLLPLPLDSSRTQPHCLAYLGDVPGVKAL